MFSVVEVASLKTLAGTNLGTLAVISSAFFVSVSDATKNSLTPEKFPLLNVKKTLDPEPTGLTFLSASNSVVTFIDILLAVSVAPPVTINCDCSENNKSSSSKETACCNILTLV